MLGVTSSDDPTPDPAAPAVPRPADADVRHLRAGGVSVLVDVTSGAPSILYWGADLGDLDADAVATVRSASVLHPRASGFDASRPLTVLPEAAMGWFGIPGVTGHRGGTAWSPRFVGAANAAGVTDAPGASGSPGSIVVDASDPDLGLAVAVTLELLPSGLLRTRAELTNAGPEPYQVDAVNLSLPVPAQATEIADFTGRWAEGAESRSGTRSPTGRTSAPPVEAGAASTHRCSTRRAPPGSASATARSGRCISAGAGTSSSTASGMPSGCPVLGRGEVLLPGEVILTTGRDVRHALASTGRTG